MMLTYELLKTKPKDFLSATGLNEEEFEKLLPAFASAYRAKYGSETTKGGEIRQRKVGGGRKGKLGKMEDKLLFALVYEKTYPLQTMQGLHFGLSQPQVNYWIHTLLPILQEALTLLGMQPEREGQALAESAMVQESPADWQLDGSERRRQRPQDQEKQREHYSGKKKSHTDKNLLIINTQTDQVVYLGPTTAGKTHDKKLADQEEITYPSATTLGKDTGFQGYEPARVFTFQPKKSPEAPIYPSLNSL